MLRFKNNKLKNSDMSKVIFQIDFKHDGPSGKELFQEALEFAKSIKEEPGLLWKVWTENADIGEGGGIYLFENRKYAVKYANMHIPRCEQMFGARNIYAKIFDINEDLTQITNGPIK
jgi:hypothetical protein